MKLENKLDLEKGLLLGFMFIGTRHEEDRRRQIYVFDDPDTKEVSVYYREGNFLCFDYSFNRQDRKKLPSSIHKIFEK